MSDIMHKLTLSSRTQLVPEYNVFVNIDFAPRSSACKATASVVGSQIQPDHAVSRETQCSLCSSGSKSGAAVD